MIEVLKEEMNKSFKEHQESKENANKELKEMNKMIQDLKMEIDTVREHKLGAILKWKI